MFLESSYRQKRLAPRCRLITSCSCRRLQGFGCSPMKVVREMGSERRETVRFLSVMGFEKCQALCIVREDLHGWTSGVTVVWQHARLLCYVWTRELLKASTQETHLKTASSRTVQDENVNRQVVNTEKSAANMYYDPCILFFFMFRVSAQ